MIKNWILLLSLVNLLSCGGKSSEERRQELVMEKQNYAIGLSFSQKKIIKSIFEGGIYLKKTSIPAKNSILVVQKRNGEIIPYVTINNRLKEKGYDVTYDSNELDYIVVIKSKGIKSGTYSDGSNAWDTETNIYVIDTKTEKISLIEHEYLKAPDKIQASRNSSPANYGARGIEGNELVQLIIRKVLK